MSHILEQKQKSIQSLPLSVVSRFSTLVWMNFIGIYFFMFTMNTIVFWVRQCISDIMPSTSPHHVFTYTPLGEVSFILTIWFAFWVLHYVLIPNTTVNNRRKCSEWSDWTLFKLKCVSSETFITVPSVPYTAHLTDVWLQISISTSYVQHVIEMQHMIWHLDQIHQTVTILYCPVMEVHKALCQRHWSL